MRYSIAGKTTARARTYTSEGYDRCRGVESACEQMKQLYAHDKDIAVAVSNHSIDVINQKLKQNN